ncbi:hypothetical protein [Peribacillus sp. TH27]|uniref:hypothetical protein n=1 Tax=Peribacillus sp. TH27 TaxID=2798484 RepID=UPI001F5BAA62|nr:hypothetical protein [Peribacillus sp. TH27]
MKIPYWGLALQIIFVLSITIFNSFRVIIMEHYSVYPVALFELFIGVISILCGMYGIIKKIKPFLSLFIIIFGLLICFFFTFVYLLPEAGTPHRSLGFILNKISIGLASGLVKNQTVKQISLEILFQVIFIGNNIINSSLRCSL